MLASQEVPHRAHKYIPGNVSQHAHFPTHLWLANTLILFTSLTRFPVQPPLSSGSHSTFILTQSGNSARFTDKCSTIQRNLYYDQERVPVAEGVQTAQQASLLTTSDTVQLPVGSVQSVQEDRRNTVTDTADKLDIRCRSACSIDQEDLRCNTICARWVAMSQAVSGSWTTVGSARYWAKSEAELQHAVLRDAVVHHQNAGPHANETIQKLKSQLLPRPGNSPDLTSSDYQVAGTVKAVISGRDLHRRGQGRGTYVASRAALNSLRRR